MNLYLNENSLYVQSFLILCFIYRRKLILLADIENSVAREAREAR